MTSTAVEDLLEEIRELFDDAQAELLQALIDDRAEDVGAYAGDQS
jgi:hypothetical protein